MANGSVTIDLTARITGYEKSLADFEKRFEHVDVGSKLGAQLSKGIQAASKELANLQKNAVQKVSSESQIEKVFDKALRMEQLLANLENGFSKLDMSDINFASFGDEITGLEKKLKSLQDSYNQTLSSKSTEAIQNNKELVNSFKELLNIDVTQMNFSQMTEALKTGMADVTKEINKAQGELNKFAQQSEASKIRQTAIKDQLSGYAELATQFSTYADKITQTKEKIATNIADLSAGKVSKAQATSLVDQLFKGLDASNIQAKLKELKAALPKDMQLGQRDFYKMILGIDVGERGNYRNVAKELLPDLSQFQSLFNELTNQLKTSGKTVEFKDLVHVGSLIDQGELQKAKEEMLRLIEQARAEAQKSLDQEVRTGSKAEASKGIAAQNLQSAQGKLNNLESIKATFDAKITELTTKLQEKQNDIDSLRRDLNALKEGKLNTVSGNGANGGSGKGNVTPNWNAAAQEVKAYSTELSRVESRMQALGKVQGVIQRWFSVYAAVRMVGQAFNYVKSTVKDLDKTITEIAIVTSKSQSDLWGQMPQYVKLADKYAASIKGVYEVSQLYYQQGLQQSDVMALTEQTLKMARISGLDYSQATDYMTNAVRSFKMEMTDAQRVVDVYSAVAASSASSVTELATAMSKTASSAQAVGASFENTTAMMAVMIEATRESPENIGSAMKSIISRYGELTTKPEATVDSEGEEMSLNRVDKALQTVGITLQDAQGQFRNFDDVIMELSEHWQDIDKNTQRYIATIMAGNRQQSRFLALVDNYARYKKLSETAMESEGASEGQFSKVMDSIGAKSQKLQNSLQALFTSTGVENLYKGFLDFETRLVDTFNQIPTLANLPIAAIGKLAVAFSSLASTVTTIFGLLKIKFQAQMSSMRETDVAEEAAYQAKLNALNEQGVNTRLSQEKQGFSAKLYNKETKTLTQTGAYAALGANIAGLALTTISSQMESQGYNPLKGWTALGGGLLSGIGTGAMIGSLPGAIVGGILGTITNIPEWLDQLEETTEESIAKFEKRVEDAQSKTTEKNRTYKSLDKEVAELKKLDEAQYDSIEARQAYQEACDSFAESHSDLVSGYDEEGHALIDLTKALEKVKEARMEAAKADVELAKTQIDQSKNNLRIAESSLSTKISSSTRTETGSGTMDVILARDYLPAVSFQGRMAQTRDDWLNMLSKNYPDADLSELSKKLESYTDWFNTLDLSPATGLLGALTTSTIKSDKYENIKDQLNDITIDFLEGYVEAYSQEDFISEYIQNENFSELKDVIIEDLENFGEWPAYIANVILGGDTDYTEEVQKIKASYTAYQGSLQRYISAAASSYIATQETATNNNIDMLDELSGAKTIVDKYVTQQVNTQKPAATADWLESSEGQTFINEATETITQLLNSLWEYQLTSVEQTNLNTLLQSSKNYTKSQFEERLREFTNDNELITAFLDALFPEISWDAQGQFNQTAIDNYQKAINTRIEKINKQHNVKQYTVSKDIDIQVGKEDKLPVDGLEEVELVEDEFIPGFIETINKYKEAFSKLTISDTERSSSLNFLDNIIDGVTNFTMSQDQAVQALEAYSEIWSATETEGIDRSLIEGVQSILTRNTDFTYDNFEDIYSQIEALQSTEEVESAAYNWYQSLLDTLTTMMKLIPKNLEASALGLKNQLTAAAESWDKKISTASKGMDYKSAQEFVDSMDLKGYDNVGDLRFQDGKYYFDDYNAIWEQVQKDYEAKITSFQNKAEELRIAADTFSGIELESKLQAITAENADFTQLSEPLQKVAEKLQLDAGSLQKYIERWYKELEEGTTEDDNFLNWLYNHYDAIETSTSDEYKKYMQKQLAGQALEAGNLTQALTILGQEDINLSEWTKEKLIETYPELKSSIENYFKNTTKTVIDSFVEQFKDLEDGKQINIKSFVPNDDIKQQLIDANIIDKEYNVLVNSFVDLFKILWGSELYTSAELAELSNKYAKSAASSQQYDLDKLFKDGITSIDIGTFDAINVLYDNAWTELGHLSMDGLTFEYDLDKLVANRESLIDTFSLYHEGDQQAINSFTAALQATIDALQAKSAQGILSSKLENGEAVKLETQEIQTLADALKMNYDDFVNKYSINQDNGETSFESLSKINADLGEIAKLTDASLAKVINSQLSSYKTMIEHSISGTTDITSMQQVAEILGKPLSEVFDLYTLAEDGKFYLNNAQFKQQVYDSISAKLPKATPEQINALIDGIFGDTTVDWQSFISAAEKGPGSKAYKTFKNSLTSMAEEDIDNLIANLADGGQTAVDAIIASGKEYTTEDLKTAYLSKRTQASSDFEQLQSLAVGSLVSGTLATALQGINGIKLSDNLGTEENAFFEVQGIVDLAEAYAEVGANLRASGEKAKAAAAELKSYTLQQTKDQEYDFSALAQIGGFASEDFSALLGSSKGVIPASNIAKVMEQNGAIKTLEDGTFDILDWTKFESDANLYGLDKTSEEYRNAYQAYLDGLGKSADSLISEVSTVSGYFSKGTTSFNDMEQFAERYKDITGETISTIGEGGLFQWDDTLQAYKLSIEKFVTYRNALAQRLQISGGLDVDEAIAEANAIAAKAITIDYSSYLSNLSDANIKQKFIQSIKDKALFDSNLSGLAEVYADALAEGGKASVAVLKHLAQIEGKDLTSSDLQNAYLSEVNAIKTAGSTIAEVTIGSLVDSTTASMLQAGKYKYTEVSDGLYLVEGMGNIVEAYREFIRQLEASGEAMLEDINQATAKLLTEEESSSVIDILQNAGKMTYSQLGDTFSKLGIKMTEALVKTMQDDQIIESLGAGNFRIIDWDYFAMRLNTLTDGQFTADTSSEAYLEALNTYNNAMATYASEQTTRISDELSKLKNLTSSSKVNLTYFTQAIGDGIEALNEELGQYGADIHNGLLSIADSTNIAGVIKSIEKAVKKGLKNGALSGDLESALADIQDVLASYFKSIAESVEKALKGTLTNREALDFSSLLKDLGLDKLNLDFFQTSDGLQLTIASAKQLYAELSKIDKVQAKLVFDKMFDSLTADGSGLEDITATLAEIERVKKQIDSTPRTANNDAVIASLEQELSLYQQIASVQMMSPESYSFMDNKLPDYIQGPLNYWNALGKMRESLKTAADPESKTYGMMSVQDFTNMVNQLGSIAKLTGGPINFMGQQISGDLESVSALLQKGYNAIQLAADGSEAMINLGSIGLNFSAGAGAMGGDVQAGVKKVAQANIDMLDSLISVLETVVAMENAMKSIGDIDLDNSGTIDFGEMFSTIINPSTGQVFNVSGLTLDEITQQFGDISNYIIKVSSSTNKVAQNILDQAKSNDDLNIALTTTSIAIDGTKTSLQDMMVKLAEGQDLSFDEAQLYLGLMNGLRTMALSGDYDLENLFTSVAEQFENAFGAEGRVIEIDIGDTKMAIGMGQVVTTYDKTTGKWLYNGTGYDNPDVVARALKAEKLAGVEAGAAKIEQTDNGYAVTATLPNNNIQLKEGNITVEIDENGNPTYTYGTNTSSDLEVIVQQLWETEGQYLVDAENNTVYKTYAEFKAALVGNLIPDVEINTDQATKVTHDQFVAAQQAWIASVQSGEWTENAVELLGQVGIKVDANVKPGELTTTEFNSITEQLKIEDQTVTITGNVEGLETLNNKVAEVQQALDSLNTAFTDFTIPEVDTSGLNGLTSALEGIVNSSKTALSNIQSMISSVGNVLSGGNATAQQTGEGIPLTANLQIDMAKVKQDIESQLTDINVGLNPETQAIQDALAGPWNIDVVINPVGNTAITTSEETSGSQQQTSQSSSTGGGVSDFDFGQVSVPPETWQMEPITIPASNFTVPDIKLNAISEAAGSAAGSAAARIASALNSIRAPYIQINNPSPVDITGNLKLEIVTSVSSGSSAGGTVTVKPVPRIFHSTWAKGNVALANGSRRTLMGELGPELVVSNGHYFVVGQDGAEFVDLDNDAIVFNHLQTRRLLSNGNTGGRGKPLTNEHNAVSYATGNAEGPAMASASAALAALKQIRAMWQAMLHASLSDLGSQAGGGGGGGGGGGNKEKASTPYGYIAELERWYTLLRQINELEREINYEEALRSKIQSDRIINGEALYASQKRSLAALDQEIAKNRELSTLQKSYYKARVADLEKTPFGKIFKFDPDTGIMTYNDEATLGSKGQRGGLFALAELNERDDTGKTKYTAEQQYKMLVEWGFADYMQYDSSGKKIESAAEKAEGKEEGPTDDDYQSEYAARVQAFWDQADAWKDELDELWDSYNEKLEEAIELEKQRNEILQAMIDNQIEVENLIESAIEAREQAEIDALQDERDALEESTNKFIEGLNDALDRERQMYQEQQDAEELNRMRRQVGILQRTGGSASQIRSLQEQIRAKEQEQYFQAQQDEIDAIQDAADAQIERLDHQIELMTETLEYQKEHGLLWAEVATIMAKTPAEIAQFITEYQPEYRSKSELQQEEYLRDIDSKIAQWVARRDDTEKPEEDPEKYALSQYRASVKAQYGMVYEKDPETAKKAEEAFLAEYRKHRDPKTATEAGNEIFAAWVREHNPHGVTDKPKPTTTTPTDPTETTETGPKQTTVDGWKLQVVTSGGRLNIRSGPGTSYSVIGQLTSGTEVKASKQENGWYYLPDYDGWISGQYARELERTKITTTLPTTGGGSGGKTTTTKGTSAPKGGAVDGIISKGKGGSQLKGYNHLSNLADNLSTNSIRGNYNIPTFDYSIPTVSMGAAAGTSTPVSNTNLGPISINIDAENIGTYEDAESLANVIEERFINIARKSGTYNYINR